MKKQLKRNLLLLLLAALYFATGFFRQYVFENINERLWEIYAKQTETFVSPGMRFITSYSYDTLYYAKWPLTLLFTMIFCLYACLIVYLLFRKKNYVKITIYAYAAVFTAGFLFAMAGMVFGAQWKMYLIARFLAGIVETPVMIIVLIPSFYLYHAGKSQEQNPK